MLLLKMSQLWLILSGLITVKGCFLDAGQDTVFFCPLLERVSFSVAFSAAFSAFLFAASLGFLSSVFFLAAASFSFFFCSLSSFFFPSPPVPSSCPEQLSPVLLPPFKVFYSLLLLYHSEGVTTLFFSNRYVGTRSWFCAMNDSSKNPIIKHG